MCSACWPMTEVKFCLHGTPSPIDDMTSRVYETQMSNCAGHKMYTGP